jgi:predicted metalloprotease
VRAPLMSPAGVRAVVVALAVAVLAGCAQVVPGNPGAAAPPPTAALAAPGAPTARPEPPVSTTATAALQEFWREAFPAAFGRPWRDIARFVPVATADPDTAVPPCIAQTDELDGQAFYCPSADAVVWDDDGLLPQLSSRFGPAGVVVVLAHEVGHAVQTRLGIDEAQAADPERYPTILLEAMSDCYAGVAMAHFAAHPVAGLPAGPDGRDEALLALVGFRDPLGVEPGDTSAHGNAFDRVSAFQDGYTDGATRCAAMSLDNRAFTERRFGSAADRARGGDLPLPRLLSAIETDARSWFTNVAASRAPGWTAPPLRTEATGACPVAELSRQGPARFCAADGAVVVDRSGLGALEQQFGDYAAATLVVSRYGLATIAAVGGPTTGPAAGSAAACLAGAYSGRLIDADGAFSLSPGDLDDAVQVLLAGDWAVRDAHGDPDPAEHGFERVGRFRAGLQGGPDACLPAR